MDGQGAGLTESLPTFLTFERFFLGVDISVKQTWHFISVWVELRENTFTEQKCVKIEEPQSLREEKLRDELKDVALHVAIVEEFVSTIKQNQTHTKKKKNTQQILLQVVVFNRFCWSSVSPVVSQMVLSPESLVTNITRVWPLVRVGPLMDEQIVGLGEMPATELANKLLFSLGRKSAPGGFSVGGQLAQLGDGPP